jgi:urease accessory protein
MNMLTDLGFHKLLTWTSPSYPIGAFTYSHGLETAVDSGEVCNVDTLVKYILAVLEHGGGWIDAVMFVHCWQSAGNDEALDELAELAAAFRSSKETALESHQQGRAFLTVTRRAWPHPALDNFAARNADRPIAHAAVMAIACAAHGISLEAGLLAYLHGTAANLVSAGVRLVPLGQTDGQIATARLALSIDGVVKRALLTPIEDLGTATPLLELASIHHETLYTRLFRS